MPAHTIPIEINDEILRRLARIKALVGEPKIIQIPDDCQPHVSEFLDEVLENY